MTSEEGRGATGGRVGGRGSAVVAAAVLVAVVSVGFGVWAIQREDPLVADLRRQLGGARSGIEAAQGELESVQRELDAARRTTGEDSQRIAKLRTRLADSVSTADMPILVINAVANHPRARLYRELMRRLVIPMAEFVDARGDVLIAVVVDVPERDGAPYAYTAITSVWPYPETEFGVKGEPLPLWQPPCTPDGCFGYH